MSRRHPFLILGLGVFAIATGGIFGRLAIEEGLPPLWVAALRVTVATLCVLPLALRGGLAGPALGSPPRHEGFWTLASGACLGLHFATWIASLEHIAVGRSVVLVTTAPLFVAVLGPLVSGDRLKPAMLLGIAVATVGAVVVATASMGSGPEGGSQAVGDGLALAGAVAIAFHWLLGRRLRPHRPLLTYLLRTYGAATLALWVGALLLAGAPPWPTGTALLAVLGMGLVAQLLGHSAFHWALKDLPAARVAVVSLLEPVGAALLALLLFHEEPGPQEILGAVIVLSGVAWTQLRGG